MVRPWTSLLWPCLSQESSSLLGLPLLEGDACSTPCTGWTGAGARRWVFGSARWSPGSPTGPGLPPSAGPSPSPGGSASTTGSPAASRSRRESPWELHSREREDGALVWSFGGALPAPSCPAHRPLCIRMFLNFQTLSMIPQTYTYPWASESVLTRRQTFVWQTCFHSQSESTDIFLRGIEVLFLKKTLQSSS